MSAIPANSIWAQMNYTPPRGSCNHQTGLLTGKCSCLRFMLHPMKSTTTFDCDGCSHHASFHNMENKEEEAILKRWQQQEKEKGEAKNRSLEARLLKELEDVPMEDPGRVIEIDDDDDDDEEYVRSQPKARRSKAATKRKAKPNSRR